MPASSLQVGSFFCEQHKQWISLLLLQKSGKQRNDNLIFALIFKKECGELNEEEYFLHISKMNERRQDTLSEKCEGKLCCEVSKLLRFV